MEYKITVISPCFNSQNTLKRCIESVIMQTIGFENIELILYDDGSTDNTKKVIKQYCDKYENIIPIFSNSNHGPGFGRDVAISKSNGEYIMFIDSDDEYEPTVCETLLNEINDDIDIVSCNYIHFDKYGSQTILSSFFDELEKSLIPHEELTYLHSFAIWNKIFKKEIIIKNNIKFTSVRNGEDEIFLKHYSLFSKNLLHLGSYVGYKHYEKSDSISHSATFKDLYDFIFVCKKIKEIYEPTGEDISILLEKRIELMIGYLYINDVLFNNYDKKELYYILNELANLEEEICFNRDLGLFKNISNFFIKHRYFYPLIIYSKILFVIGKLHLKICGNK